MRFSANARNPSLRSRLRARKDFDTLEQRSKVTPPMPRLGLREDITMAVLFFASSLADFVSAQTLNIAAVAESGSGYCGSIPAA